MFGERLRELREAEGLTQRSLAARAGVSRQLIGAVEAGRHLPRVDAAAALASALGVTVESLLGSATPQPEPVVGAPPPSGSPVRLGRVGDRFVCAPLPRALDGWAAADGLVDGSGVERLNDARPGAVVVGCDPALGLVAELVGERASDRLLAVGASSTAALDALTAGRSHAAVVHGPDHDLPPPPLDVLRWRLSRWQVGLAADDDGSGHWWETALSGRQHVIRREAGAGTQAAFERAIAAAGATAPEGPVVGGHVEAAWLAARTGLPAVTIEPAARAAGLAFRPLETHVAELWIDVRWRDEPALRRVGEILTSSSFTRRLAAVGGYDLHDTGSVVDP